MKEIVLVVAIAGLGWFAAFIYGGGPKPQREVERDAYNAKMNAIVAEQQANGQW